MYDYFRQENEKEQLKLEEDIFQTKKKLELATFLDQPEDIKRLDDELQDLIFQRKLYPHAWTEHDEEIIPILWAVRNGHTKIVEMLLHDGRIDPTAYDNFAIITASEKGYTDIVKLLLEDGRVDPTVDNDAINWACLYGYADIVEALLQDGRVDPTVNDNYILKLACEKGYTKVVEVLLRDGRVSLPEYLYTPTEEIKEMLDKYKYRVDGPEYQKAKKTL